MSQPNVETQGVQLFTGATVNGVQTQAEVLMQRHTPQDWPTAAQALTKWGALVDQLKAEDRTVKLKALAINPKTGGLVNRAKDPSVQHPGVTPTKTALQHLVSFMPGGPDSNVANLEFYPPRTRAIMFQDQLDRLEKDRDVVMRLAMRDLNSYVVRAVTSEIHSQENGDDKALIAQINRLPSNILQESRMRVIKEWDYTHVELVIPNKVREVKKGVVINARINIKNSETKGGSFESSVGTFNLVCLNGMVAGGANSTVTIKHVGDIRSRMGAGVRTVIELVDVYLEEYFQAYQRELTKPRAEVIEQVTKQFKLPKDTGAALNALWDVDGERGAGHTVAGLANALTRHAQSLPVEKALQLEGVAGQVLNQFM